MTIPLSDSETAAGAGAGAGAPAGSPREVSSCTCTNSSKKWMLYLLLAVVLFLVVNVSELIKPDPRSQKEPYYNSVLFPIKWDASGRHEPKNSDLHDVLLPLPIKWDDSKYHEPKKEPKESEATDNKNDDGFYPVDSGQDKVFWPFIPEEHWEYMPRVFSAWNSTYPWCGSSGGSRNTGLILVKVHKAASSTLAGVNLRIAQHHGSNGTSCSSRQTHDDSRLFRRRDPERSFMYTSIRDPAHRAMSWIMYIASNQGHNITDAYIVKKLKVRIHFVRGGDANTTFLNEAGAQVGYLHTGNHLSEPLWKPAQPNKVQNLRIATSRVSDVLQQYDLILIVERLSESLVVLQLLLDLKTSDILHLSSKLSGGYSYSSTKPFVGCHKITKSYISPAVATYLSSSQWYAQNYQDYLLYKAANQSLDSTIDSLGRDRFKKALSAYKHMMDDAKECESESVFPCSSAGVYQSVTNCYALDWGCGYPCLDRRFGT